jgi:hypothetical protein
MSPDKTTVLRNAQNVVFSGFIQHDLGVCVFVTTYCKSHLKSDKIVKICSKFVENWSWLKLIEGWSKMVNFGRVDFGRKWCLWVYRVLRTNWGGLKGPTRNKSVESELRIGRRKERIWRNLRRRKSHVSHSLGTRMDQWWTWRTGPQY